MSLRSPMLLLAGAFASVLLALFGLVLLRGNSLAVGTAVIIAAVVVFLASTQRLRTSIPADTSLLQDVKARLPLGLIGVAIFLSLLAVYEVGQPRTLIADQISTVAWIGSILCFAVGLLWWEHWKVNAAAIAEWLKNNRAEAILVAAIFVAALVARLVLLAQHPFPWSGDEASVGMEARRFLQGQNHDIFSTGWSGQPNLSFIPTAVSLAIFGETLFALRIVSALVGALSVITLYFAARVLFDRTVAAIAAAFLITFPFHLQFSRIGVSNIADTLMVTLCLWLTVRALKQDTRRAFMWAGFATGLALYTYVGSRLVIALGVAAVIYFIIRRPAYLREHGWHLGTYAAALVIMMAPMAYYMARHPDIFMTRLAQTGIMFQGWLPQEAARTGQSIVAILLNQFERSTLVFISQGALGNFFNSPEPYLNIFGALFFLIGMGFAFQHLLDFPYAVTLLWFWSVVIFGGVLTLDPPANTRLIMTAPAVAIFLGLGMQQVLRVLTEIKISGRWSTALGTTMVALLLIQNALFYFGPYRTGYYFSDANSEVAEAVGMELRSLGPNYNLYMIGQPRMYAGFPTIAFLAPRSARIDLAPTEVETADLSKSLPALLVATPDNQAALVTLASRYPGGQWQTVPRQTKPETLYYAYVLSGGTTKPAP